MSSPSVYHRELGLVSTSNSLTAALGENADGTCGYSDALPVAGEGRPHGTRNKQRILLLSMRVCTILELCSALNDRWFVGTRTAQKIVKPVVNRG